MASIQKKSLDSSPDETRTFEKGKIELAKLGDVTIGRATLEPGWSWEKYVKQLVNTNSCQAPHTQYMISGRLKIVMDDGKEEEFLSLARDNNGSTNSSISHYVRCNIRMT